jgi:hypothetical protein
VIHVYAVVDGLEELPPLAGLDDAPLERQQVDGLEVVLSRARTPPSAEVTREAVLRHAQVVEGLLARSGAVLPAQLGRAFRDEDELVDSLRAQATQLGRSLDRVRGCVEFGLRVLPAAEGRRSDASSGAEYMRVRLDELRGQDRLVAELHEPLARLARESALQRDDGGIRAAYLVERKGADSFRETARSLERATELAVICTGPWPPYSFANGEP